MYSSALSIEIISDVEFSRRLVESRSDKLKQVKSRNETTQLASRNETTQLVSRNEKQLNSSVGTKPPQLCTAVDRLQPPATAYNRLQRLQPPATAYNRLQPPTTACNRLQPPATACTACTAFTAESAFSTYIFLLLMRNAIFNQAKPNAKLPSDKFITTNT
ncbi:hypothetical protein TNCV_4415351 [Trichonephila clavipes]|uniref:Uncharacterized protein n=1 Tax=Trichonephila clavipes TaxID=2585209 RepID=A0A8X6V4G8_TRICX|nr:hypothetical protein TNCV_4415351 [Trichonephila clavipes]